MTSGVYKHTPNSYRGKVNGRYKHGNCNTKLYYIWANMLQRCFNKNCKLFPRYGGRDIYVEDESWWEFTGFRDWATKSGYQEGLSIDRKNNDLGYYPENCQWITKSENSSKRGENDKIIC